MKMCVIVATCVVLLPSASFAQTTERGYLTGIGGFAVTPETTSRDVVVEGGVRIAPHLLVFGDVGRFHDLQPSDVQDNIDLTTQASADQGLAVVGTGRVPAVYSVGGLRFQPTSFGRVSPYIMGGVGVAHLKPTARFTYSSGTLPDGSTPAVGDDVTTQLESAFDFSLPLPSTSLMTMLGGGVEVPLSRHWAVDADYRYSRIAADTPFNVQGAAFGFGYRF
jgi:opacity protein-like surface antigen